MSKLIYGLATTDAFVKRLQCSTREYRKIHTEGRLLPSLTHRQMEPELMDDPALDEAEHARALHGLARIHRLTGTTGRLWNCIRKQLGERTKLSVMDVGCGDGRMLRELFKVARSKGIELELHACDFSDRALQLAADAAAEEQIPLTTHRVDVTRDQLPLEADVVICSLFLHHFMQEDVVSILSKLQRATQQHLLVEDLLRSRLGYVLCKIGVHALSRSRIVHVDGPLSVRAAFTLSEMRDLTQKAGLESASIVKHWPERFLLQWFSNPTAHHA